MGIEIHKNWHAKSFICLKSQHWSLKSNNFFLIGADPKKANRAELTSKNFWTSLTFHQKMPCKSSGPSRWSSLRSTSTNLRFQRPSKCPRQSTTIWCQKKNLELVKLCRIRLFSSLPCLLLEGHAFFLRREIKLPRRLLSRLWAEPLHPAMIVGFFSRFKTQPLQYHTQCPLSKRKMWKLHQEKWIPTVPDSHPFRKSMEIFRMQGPFFATPPAQLLINLTHSPQTPRSSSHLLTVSQPSWPGQEIAKTHGCLLLCIGIKDTNTEIFVLLIHVKFSTKYYIWLEILEWLSQICNRSICIISIYTYPGGTSFLARRVAVFFL